MKTLSLKYRKIISTIFKTFSLTGMMFAFQSCYGMPRCGDDEVLFRGKVVSSDSKRAIEGIRVSIADTSEYHHKYRYRHDITDNNGNYNFYACGRDLRYQRHDIFFEDVDSTQNGLYESKSMVIQYGSQNEIEINVTLDEVK